MRRISTVAACLLAAACNTSTGGGPVGDTPDPVMVDMPGGHFGIIDVVREDNTSTAWMPVPPEDVWLHLPAVYGAIGLPLDRLTVLDETAHRIGTSGYRTRRLADRRLSRLLECGYSMGAPKADNGQVRVDLHTWLEPHDGGTNVRTRLEAVARSGGTSSSAVKCSTNGALEKEIVNRLHLRVLKERS
jgi:hypothetical protein